MASNTAERILAEAGLDIRDDDECLVLFKKAGVKVRGMHVTFEPGHVREILKTAPKNSPNTLATRSARFRSGEKAWCTRPPMVRLL
jgi:trimethylamine:corrinoid methyltransferase-like protein